MPVTVSHVLSATTPDDPAFEIRPSHWNSSHLFTLNAVGGEISNAFGNAGGVSFGYDGTNVTAQASAAPSPINFSAGTTSNNLGSVVFSNSNGISFGLSGSTITGTVATNYQSQGAYLTTAMQSNAATISNINISAGTTSTNASAFTFSNSNNFTFGLGTGANAGVITGSYTVPSVTNSSWTVSDTATSATVGRLAFTASNGITMTLSTSNNGNHTLIASYTVPNVPAATSWTVSDTATSATVGRLAFTNSNGITATLSTSNNGNHTVIMSHNGITSQSTQFLAMTLAGNTAGTTTFNASNNATLFFNGGNNITLSGNGSTVTISAASQTNQTVGFYALGTTTGQSSSSTWDARTLSFAGAGAISLGNSSNSGLIISSPVTSSIVGTNGISVSTNGSTISVLPNWISSYENMEGLFGTATTGWTAGSVSHAVVFNVPWALSLSFIRIPISMTTQSTTLATLASNTASAQAGLTHTFNAGIYSLGVGGNSKSLQSVTTGTATYVMSQKISITSSTRASYSLAFSGQANGGQTSLSTQYSVSNTNYSFTTDQIATAFSGLRFLDIPCAASLSPGPYWLVIGMSSNSSSAGAALGGMSNCGVSYSNHYAATMVNSAFGIMGSTDFTSGGLLGAGSFSTAGGGTTNSIPISAISSNASQARLYFQMLRSA